MITNYEYIKNMSVEEMADFIHKMFGFSCDICKENDGCTPCSYQCVTYCTRWLESEVKK